MLGKVGLFDLYTAVCLDENCLTSGWKCNSSRCAPAVRLKPCAPAGLKATVTPHPLFNPDAGSRTLVSKQLHVLVCVLLISFMKTKISFVIMQERFELLVPQGWFVYGGFGFWESCTATRICMRVSDYNAAEFKLCSCSCLNPDI